MAEQIEQNEYATISQILEAMVDPDQSQSLSQRRVARVLPGVMAKLGLRKVTCTAELKRRLKITSRGHPKVIMQVNALP